MGFRGSGEPVWAGSFEGPLQTHDSAIYSSIRQIFNESLLCARNSSSPGDT